MALFSKEQPSPQQATVKKTKISGDVISSIISTEMRVTGELNFKGKARVDGTVDGNIKGEHLILSETGRVIGDLELASLVCHGAIEGNVKAQQVTAHANSSIKGNLVAASLTVESGARLNGEVSSSTQAKAAGAAQPSATTATAAKTEVPEKKEV